MASLSLKAFAAGLLPLVLVKVLAPAYFAEEDTRSPFRVGVIAVGVNICINLALFRIMGHVGLALGTTCAAWVNAALLARGLVRSRRLEVPRQTVWFALRCLVGVAVMVMVMAWLAPPGGLWLAAGVAERTAWLLGLVAAGGVSYLAAVVLCGIRPAQLLHRA
jgi:putative peptidoglycan lipid II flippase